MKSGAALASLILVSCATDETVREDHHGGIYPTVRVTHALQEPEAHGQSPRSEVELQVSMADDSTELIDFELLQVAAAVRWNLVHDDKATLGLFAGVALERNEFDVGAPYGLHDEENQVGPLIGVRFGVRVVPRLELYGRVQRTWYLVEPGNSNQLEAGASVRLSDAVSVFAAWRRWDVKQEDFDDFQLDEIDLDTDGIAFGLEFWF